MRPLDWRAVHPHKLVLHALLIAGALLLLVTVAAAGSLSWLGLLLFAGSVLATTTTRGGSYAVLAATTTGALLWVMSDTTATSWWAVPVALELTLIQVAGTLTGLGPQEAALPQWMMRLWIVRTGWVLVATAVTGVAALLLATEHRTGSAYLAAGLLVAVAVGIALLPRLFTDQDA